MVRHKEPALFSYTEGTHHVIKRILGPVIVAALLAGCGGGSSTPGSTLPKTPTKPQAKTSLGIAVTIGGGTSTKSSSRRPMYVSHGTNGAEVYITAHGAGFSGVTPTETDVSSGSAACGGSTGFPRTCTITVNNVTVGSAIDILINTYDAAPSGGTHQGNLLSSGESDNVVINGGSNNNVTVTLLGVPATVIACPMPSSYHAYPVLDHASRTSLNIQMCAEVEDADGNVITGSDNLASGYSVQFSAESLPVTQDGIGGSNPTSSPASSRGYFEDNADLTGTSLPAFPNQGSVTYTAAIMNGASVVNSANLSAPVFSSNALNGVTLGLNQAVTINVEEDGYTSAYSTSVTGGSCATVSPAAPVQANGTTPASLTITAGSSTGTCTVMIYDADQGIQVPVTVQNTQVSVPININ